MYLNVRKHEMFLSPYFTPEPTELTGLFVEKPPENVVAVSGLSLYIEGIISL